MNATRGTVIWPAVDPRAGRWLFGARSDVFWVAGLGSLLFGAVAVPVSTAAPASALLLVAVFQHLAAVCNQPHYAITYDLIVRERGRARSSFSWLAASTPVALLVLGYAAFVQTSLIGVLNRVYLTWSAYHYAAQHFGLASMYQARDGKPLAPREKRALQVGFAGAAAYVMILLNTRDGLGGGALFGNDHASTFALLFPPSVVSFATAIAFAGLGAYALAETWHARRIGAGLRREARLLFLTNLCWFVVPYVHLPGAAGPWTGDRVGAWLPYALPFFHCAQYLGVCGWRARTTGPVKPIFAFMKLVAIGFLLFQGITWVVGHAARIDGEAAVVLVLAVVNIHHFFLDGLMWKARRRPALTSATAAREEPGATISTRSTRDGSSTA